MSAWRNDEPPENEFVEVRGLDYLGEWHGVAKRVEYKKKPKGFTETWRWVDHDGDRYVDQDVVEWREI